MLRTLLVFSFLSSSFAIAGPLDTTIEACRKLFGWSVNGRAAELTRTFSTKAVLGDFDAHNYVRKLLRDKKHPKDVNLRAQELKGQWIRRVGEVLAAADATGREKVAAYERLAKVIESRSNEIENAYNELNPDTVRHSFSSWSAKKRDVGGGVVIFIGGLGYIVEIRPDGSMYYGAVFLKSGEYSTEKDWVPPYNEDGQPKEHLFRKAPRHRMGPPQPPAAPSESDLPKKKAA